MAANSGAVRAGGAFVELFAKDGALRTALDRAEARVKKFGGMMAKAGAAIAGSGAAVAGPLQLAAKFAIDSGAEVSNLARDLGTTAEEITAFGYAAAQSGVQTEKLNGFLAGLPDTLSNLADGSGASAEMLSRLNVPARALINLPFPQQMEMLTAAVRGVADPIDRARVATELFGDVGRDLLPLLEKGADGLRGLTAEAKAAGQVMTTEQAKKAAAAQRALTSAWEAGKRAFMEVGQALIPGEAAIEKLRAGFQRGAEAVRNFVRQNGPAIAVVAAVATGVVIVGTALASLGVVVAGIAAGVGTVLGVVGGVLAAIVSPLGLFVAGVAAAGAALYHFAGVGKETVGEVAGYFGTLKDTFGQAWGGIVSAVRAGDLNAAFAVVTTSLDMEWKRAIVKLTEAWAGFKAFFVDAWHDGMMMLELGILKAQYAIADTIVDICTFMTDNFAKAFDAIIEGAAKLANALGATGTAADILAMKGVAALDTKGLKKTLGSMQGDDENELFKKRQQQQDASDASRGDDLAAARGDFARAEQAFAAALSAAAAAEEKRDAVAKADKPPGKTPTVDLPSLSRGTFTSSSYAQAFAAPSGAMRQLRETEKTNDLLDKILDALHDDEGKGGLVFS